MLSKIRWAFSWLKTHCPLLFADKMPIWLTILASLIAAYATYEISPAINRQFEIDAARNSHIAKTTDNLNLEIIALSQKIRRFNDAELNDPSSSGPILEDSLDLVTQLQWQLVDLRIVLTSPDDVVAVDRLAKALTSLHNVLGRAKGAKSQDALLESMRVVAVAASDVLNRLYVRSALKVQ